LVLTLMQAEGFAFEARFPHGGWRHGLLPRADDGRWRAEIDMASLDPKRYGDWMTTNSPPAK
jgi:hypothetical protein